MVLTGLNVRYRPPEIFTTNGYDTKAKGDLPKELRPRTRGVVMPYLSAPERMSKASKFAIDFWTQKKRMDAADEHKESVRLLLGMKATAPDPVYNVRVVNPYTGGGPGNSGANASVNDNSTPPPPAPRPSRPPPVDDIAQIHPATNTITTDSSNAVNHLVHDSTSAQDAMEVDRPLQQVVTNNHFYQNQHTNLNHLVQNFTNNENHLHQLYATQNNQFNAYVNNNAIQNTLHQNMVQNHNNYQQHLHNNQLQQNLYNNNNQLHLHNNVQNNNQLQQHLHNNVQNNNHLHLQNPNSNYIMPGLAQELIRPAMGPLGINGRPPRLAIQGPGTLRIENVTSDNNSALVIRPKKRRSPITSQDNLNQSSSSTAPLVPYRRPR